MLFQLNSKNLCNVFFSKLQIIGFCDLDTHYETYILLVDYLKLRIFFSRLFLTDIDFRKAGFILVYYLVGFRICAETSRMLKKNRLEKLVSPVIRSPLLTHQPCKILPDSISLLSKKFLLYFHEK